MGTNSIKRGLHHSQKYLHKIQKHILGKQKSNIVPPEIFSQNCLSSGKYTN